MLRSIVALSLLSLLLSSCVGKINRHVKELAKDNCTELEKTLARYEGDSRKKDAALFLINNMIGKASLSYMPEDEKKCEEMIERTAGIDDPYRSDEFSSLIKDSIAALRNEYDISCAILPDVEYITSDILIENIDKAFEQWERTPWHNDYSFEDFCEYVLPYRMRNEKVESWRDIARNDSLLKNDSYKEYLNDIVMQARKIVENIDIEYCTGLGGMPFVPSFAQMSRLKAGDCVVMSDYAIACLRARGIPTAIDKIPAWANRSAAHQWNAVILPNGKIQDIGYNPDGDNIIRNKLSKIYRETFSIQRNSLIYRKMSEESIPAFFSSCRIVDVTDQYDIPLSDIEINGLNSERSEIAYLATFDNKNWVPVAYSLIKNGTAIFKNVGRGVQPEEHMQDGYIDMGDGIAYNTVQYINGEVSPVGTPFILHADGEVDSLVPDFSTRRSVILNRKYPLLSRFDNYADEMSGGVWIGACREDFSDAAIIHKEGAMPRRRKGAVIPIGGGRKYRYIKFVAHDSSEINIAEIEFFGKTGKIPVKSKNAAINKMFDGNILTYYSSSTRGDSFSLDLGSPVEVVSMKYRVRTEDNDINVGHKYRLCYWDGGWRSLGDRVAQSDTLVYDNVPDGALLILHDLTSGVEERPFTYTDKQVWW